MTQIFRYKILDDLLEDLAEELDVPASRYEAAERAYNSVGAWLERPESALRVLKPRTYVQGSFALGTATKPVTDEDDYDVDAVCELQHSKASVTQQQLKDSLGEELRLYARAQSMNEEPERRNRCWMLPYADEAQFHLDVLPSLPDAATAQILYEQRGLTNPWGGSALAITDERHPEFRVISPRWLRSNPKGYAAWFRSRMAVVFDQRRRMLAERARAKVEDIPEYKVKTPLQAAIQILKRHRDIWALDQADRKPISIILTTLGARAYQQETSVAAALFRLLQDMDKYIERRGAATWIANPSDPLENFADRWILEPDREVAFHEWLERAKSDFRTAASYSDRAQLIAVLSGGLGERAVRVAAGKRVATPGLLVTISRSLKQLFNAPHREKPAWPEALVNKVSIADARVEQKGFRPKKLTSDGGPLPKNCSLTFIAQTDVQHPYRVYWQIVNTGADATRANGLRGQFEEGIIERGTLTRKEGTEYVGTHSIECFIVKDGLLVARSQPFIVNIR